VVLGCGLDLATIKEGLYSMELFN